VRRPRVFMGKYNCTEKPYQNSSNDLRTTAGTGEYHLFILFFISKKIYLYPNKGIDNAHSALYFL
jgi:hypothetical protein